MQDQTHGPRHDETVDDNDPSNPGQRPIRGMNVRRRRWYPGEVDLRQRQAGRSVTVAEAGSSAFGRAWQGSRGRDGGIGIDRQWFGAF
jgi:hypothetical protein